MDFTVRCDCGRPMTVSEGSAGATLACPCGQPVAIPSLGKLRQSAGLTAVWASAGGTAPQAMNNEVTKHRRVMMALPMGQVFPGAAS